VHLALFVLVAAGCEGGPPPPEGLELLITGGTIVDGTGAPRHEADVALIGDRIAWVGRSGRATAPDSIDATGLVVAPGFIDAHSHTTPQIAREAFKLNEGVVRQGVTTVVGGPDGSLSAGMIRRLVAAHDSLGIGTNVAYYVGHNAIRSEVLGDDQRRAPTPPELEAMRAEVREGMELGALGLSTGLMYEPGMFSETGEVIALAEEVAPFGGIYDSHVRDPVHAFLASDREVVRIAEAAGIGGKIGHIKGVGLHNAGVIADVIEMVEAARDRGVEIVSDQYPYDGAATAPLAAIVVVPTDLPGLPTFRGLQAGAIEPDAESMAGARAEIVEAASDPDGWAALREASENGVDGGFAWLKATGYTSMRVVSAPERPDLVGRYLSELAEESGKEPFRVVTDLLGEGADITVTLGAIEEADVRTIMVRPWNMIASDGGWADGSDSPEGHPRSAGTFARLLGHYVREEGVLTLEDAVRKITSLPAGFLGLDGRGRIGAGDVADLVVFDPGTIIDRSDWDHPNRFAVGVEYVFVNGVPVLSGGEMTGAAPGRFVLRGEGS
jgi:N-acyl-D-aspartate/D-glutamate deacylase